MRRAARIDANHQEVVKLLRACGASVQALASIGAGVPDLLVGFRGRNVLLEVKDGAKKPSARKLTPDEKDWHAKWAGQVCTVKSPQEALKVVMGEAL